MQRGGLTESVYKGLRKSAESPRALDNLTVGQPEAHVDLAGTRLKVSESVSVDVGIGPTWYSEQELEKTSLTVVRVASEDICMKLTSAGATELQQQLPLIINSSTYNYLKYDVICRTDSGV